MGKKSHEGHSEHLCAMVAGGDGYQAVRRLVADAQYICAKCGRAARRKRNLCAPRKL